MSAIIIKKLISSLILILLILPMAYSGWLNTTRFNDTYTDTTYTNTTASTVDIDTSGTGTVGMAFTESQINTSAILSAYKMGQLTDETGNYDLTQGGSISIDANGIVGNATSFDDKSSYYTNPNHVNFADYNESFSFSGWFKTTDTWGALLIWKETGSNGNTWLKLANSTSISFNLGSGGAGQDMVYHHDIPYNDDEWYFFAVTHNKTHDMFYFNGELKFSRTSLKIFNTGTDFFINSYTGAEGIDASIDEVYVWSQSLTAEQVYYLNQSFHPFSDAGGGYSNSTFYSTGLDNTAYVTNATLNCNVSTQEAGTDITNCQMKSDGNVWQDCTFGNILDIDNGFDIYYRYNLTTTVTDNNIEVDYCTLDILEDILAPIITSTSPSEDNSTSFNIIDGTMPITFDLLDDTELSTVSINITRVNDSFLIYNLTNSSLSGLTYSFNSDVDISGWGIGNFTEIILACNGGVNCAEETYQFEIYSCVSVFDDLVITYDWEACLINDTRYRQLEYNDSVCDSGRINQSDDGACDYCTPSEDVFCITWDEVCPINYTQSCSSINNTCYDETGLGSDLTTLSRGCVGTYGANEIPEAVIDIFVGIGAVIFSLVSVIALLFLVDWIQRKWKGGSK